ncbi:low molecular weight protein-tyrosine-phosphatase [Marinomonas transparens]|uniref:protein-tyrosine-phosphatase n=1 Tax=Marinomonas transparens TaxID=2795388 RepID=A0A934MWG9_9GAMM|nr:low molecular weight protein-tyrosine-phosphatase [Marinomonas transparens]MBJ7538149.1 low molecular weight phosphotyrosine protein phosphatase [Marinomonas transparens]
MKPIKVLTVCLGNICRSPAAQGILEKALLSERAHFEVDSAGTAAYHVGNPPDPRSIAALAKEGIDIRKQEARQVSSADFDQFDWILAMDRENLRHLKKLQPSDSKAKLVMFGEFAGDVSYGEIADPYYGGDEGFILMREHLTQIARAFVKHLDARPEINKERLN